MYSHAGLQNPSDLFKLTLIWASIFVLGTVHFLLAFVLEPLIHMTLGVVFLVLSFMATAFLAWGWRRTSRELWGVQSELQRKGRERDAWRQRAQAWKDGVGKAIEAQMEDWNLTPTEKNVAMLILKGYSHKDIARLNERSERTVRQHAVDVYRKAGVSGRAELSAFFLEDLL